MVLRTNGFLKPGMRLLIGILLATLALTGVLAFEAQNAARSHRATAEQSLHDYAAVAAFLYARNATSLIRYAVASELAPAEPIVRAEPGGGLPSPGQLFGGWHGNWLAEPLPRLDSVRYHFLVDFRGTRFETVGVAVPAPGTAQWLREAVMRTPRMDRSVDYDFGAIIAGPDRFFGFASRYDERGHRLFAYGFEAHPAALRPGFRKIYEEASLLPPTLTGGAPNERLLSIEVIGPEGSVLFSAGEHPEAGFEGGDTVSAALGGLMVRAAVLPSAADMLVIGGLPGSRVPLLLGLLALTAGLVAAALFLLRHEAELARLRSDFISSVSHELRTPLAQIRMFAETLRLGRTRSEEERRRSIDIIDQESRRLATLVENVLLFSRAERGNARFVPESTDLEQLIRRVRDSFEPIARSRAVEVRLDTVPARASVDRNGIWQILVNLLDNAVKYGPVGQTVTVSLRTAGTIARITVDDQGPGIPPRHRQRIFEEFQRLDDAEASGIAGSGIGLAVVRQIARAHGGQAYVTTAPGGGARFVVEIPGVEPAGAEGPGGRPGAVAPAAPAGTPAPAPEEQPR